MEKSLGNAKKALVDRPTLETNKIFGEALAVAVDRGEWIAAPVIPNEHGNRYVIQMNKGRPYIVLYSDEEHYHFEKGISLMMTEVIIT